MGESDVGVTSMDHGSLFPPGGEEDPRDWVTNDPWDWPSYFYKHGEDVFTDVYTHEEGAQEERSLYIPGKESRICSKYDRRQIPMYDIVFREMGLRLPFSDFEVAIFRHLRLAPSQLHRNGITFMRAFEIVCDHLKIGATIQLFFYCFHI